ncbi:MAG: FMN-binding negative transcriptional regulator [Caulobacteraceae bacterium]
MTGTSANKEAGPGLFAPGPYRSANPAAIIAAYPFGLLATGGENPYGTWVPMVFERVGDPLRLVGHLARRNPHAEALAPGAKALAAFLGPHAYITPRWYLERPEVPTWDYVAAQARGTLEPIDEEAAQRAILDRIVEEMERGAAEPWRLEKAPIGRIEQLLPLIRSFRIEVESLEGSEKLSQNHPASDRRRVVEGLRVRGQPGDGPIASLIEAAGGGRS